MAIFGPDGLPLTSARMQQGGYSKLGWETPIYDINSPPGGVVSLTLSVYQISPPMNTLSLFYKDQSIRIEIKISQQF